MRTSHLSIFMLCLLAIVSFLPMCAVLAQSSPPFGPESGSTTPRVTAEGRAVDPTTDVWTPLGMHPGGASAVDDPTWSMSRTNLRGVEWISQDRGAIYNQPGELIRVRIKWSSSTPITAMRVKKDLTTQFACYDDGTHGDAVAGDGIWSLDSLSGWFSGATAPYAIAKDALYGSAVTEWFPVEWHTGDGNWENDGYAYIRVGLVDPLYTLDVAKLGNGIWATSHAFFIEDSLQSERTFPGYPATNTTWSYLMKPAAKLLFAHMPDAYDFVVVTPATPVWIPGPLLSERVPNAAAVRNAVTGIGMSAFNNTADWGSAGRMQTIVYHSFGPFSILAHELGHRWMAYLDSLTFTNGACGVHWADHQTIGGNMSLWPKIIETAPGVFKGVTRHTPDAFNATYSDLDLYLMGLKPLSAVPVIKRLNGADYTVPDTVRYTSVTTIAPATLPGRYGTRVPAYPSAQHDFTMATIVVKPLAWKDAEFAYFSLLARHAADTLDDGFGYNYCFEKAAKGTATLDSRIFTPTGMPLVPALNSPADHATGQPLTVKLMWDSSRSTTSYQIQLSRKAGFSDTVMHKAGITGTSATPAALLPGTTYYWRVRAIGTGGMSQYSTSRMFTTGTATALGEAHGELPFSFSLSECYPNPFNPQTTIGFSLPARSLVTLAVFDPLGQLVAELVNGEVEPGNHVARFDGSSIASGVYYCRLLARPLDPGTGGDVVRTRTLVLIR